MINNLQSIKVAFGVNHQQILFSSFSGLHDVPISDEILLWGQRKKTTIKQQLDTKIYWLSSQIEKKEKKTKTKTEQQ